MKKNLIAGAATLLALGVLQIPTAFAQSSSGDTTTQTPGATGTTPPAPGSVPPTSASKAGTDNQAATPPAANMQKNASLSDTSSPGGGPAKGANSFTEGQAQGRISDAGYTSVGGLKKDTDGIWRGTAMKNGQQVGVWLDYTGHVGQS